jgi:hypothetical protein
MATLGQPTAVGSGVARVASRHSDTNFPVATDNAHKAGQTMVSTTPTVRRQREVSALTANDG